MSQQFHFQDLFNIYENICLNKDFYMDVEGNIILNSCLLYTSDAADEQYIV